MCSKNLVFFVLNSLVFVSCKKYQNCQILNKIYGIEHVAQCRMLNDKILEMDYIEGQSFSDLAIKAMYEGGVAGLSGYIEFYCNFSCFLINTNL